MSKLVIPALTSVSSMSTPWTELFTFSLLFSAGGLPEIATVIRFGVEGAPPVSADELGARCEEPPEGGAAQATAVTARATTVTSTW
jgi:hypothetical protein